MCNFSCTCDSKHEYFRIELNFYTNYILFYKSKYTVVSSVLCFYFIASLIGFQRQSYAILLFSCTCDSVHHTPFLHSVSALDFSDIKAQSLAKKPDVFKPSFPYRTQYEVDVRAAIVQSV
jgi:hypothetical protein